MDRKTKNAVVTIDPYKQTAFVYQNNEIKNWRGNFQQTDDILVLGFSLKILF
jgi:hypothetical protein